MDVGEAQKDFTVEAKTGGGDRDKYVVSSDAVITDFEADSDKWIYVNGERYRYKADRDVIEADGVPLFAPNTGDEDDSIIDDEKSEEQKEREEEKEEEKNQNIVDELIDLFNNPLKPENTAKIVLLGILTLLIVRVIGLYDSS